MYIPGYMIIISYTVIYTYKNSYEIRPYYSPMLSLSSGGLAINCFTVSVNVTTLSDNSIKQWSVCGIELHVIILKELPK